MESLTLPGAIIIQVVFSFFYIYFIIRPLSEIEKINGRMNYGYRLLIIRTIIVVGLDILNYRFSTILDIITLIAIAFIVTPRIKKELDYVQKVDSRLAKYNEVTAEELSSNSIKDRKVLEQTLFNKLKLIQESRSKYDYDTLRRICTDKMYNLFANELRMVEESELHYNYENYKLKEVQIFKIESTEKELIINVAIKASCIFYRTSNNGDIVDGSKSTRTIIAHELEFIKDITTEQKEENCQNCGAPTKTTTKGKCEYCHTIINKEYSGWRVSKHKVVAEQLSNKITE